MHINRILAGAMVSVLALGAVAPAFADNDRHRDRREWRDDRRDHRNDHRNDRRVERRHDPRGDYRDHRYYRSAPPPRVVYRPAPPPRVVYRPAPPPRQSYGWRVGAPYRNYYSGPVYVVNDYHRYHVRQPPRGHRWIRDDRGNLLLVAIATGILADFVINGR